MYDSIIIGGGPAGLNAALYLGRAGLTSLIIEKLFLGGQAATTYEVDNYIGFDAPISGPELMSKMEAHAKRFGVETFFSKAITLKLDDNIKEIVSDSGIYKAKTVILATGATPRQLGLSNEDALRGSGVSYCATCDGMFYRGKNTIVVGGGDTAIEDALFLSKLCKKVYLVHRRQGFRAAKVLIDKLHQNDKIELLLDSVVTSLNASETLESVDIKNLNTNEVCTIEASGIFVAIGVIPQNDIINGIITTDKSNYIITDENMQTNIAGVYAAGDNRKKSLRQIITAASDGAIAANSAINYILSKI